jgi:hypothetical protein
MAVLIKRGNTSRPNLVGKALGSLHGGDVGVHQYTLDVAILERLDGLGACIGEKVCSKYWQRIEKRT